jgi:hypothetical protein
MVCGSGAPRGNESKMLAFSLESSELGPAPFAQPINLIAKKKRKVKMPSRPISHLVLLTPIFEN